MCELKNQERILKPIKGEEWIERKRSEEFWISSYRGWPMYARLVKSYVGWWIYYRVYRVWGRAAILIDPLSCGGLRSHVRSFLFNWLVVDVWWGTKHRIWRLFHKKQWQQQCRLMRACMQATAEGCGDPMQGPDWLPADRFHGVMLGKRYFERVAELMQDE